MKKNLVKLFAFVLALSMTFSLAACSLNSGDEETTEPIVISATPKPSTSGDVIAYFNSLINEVKTKKPAVKLEEKDKKISDFESDNKSLKAAFPTLKNYILSDKKEEVAYGEDSTAVFPIKGEAWSSKLTVDDVRYAICVQNGDSYEITILFREELSPEKGAGFHSKAFNIPDRNAIVDEFKTSLKDYLEISGIDSLKYKDCKIVCTVDRETDQIRNINYYKNVDISTTVTGIGTLKEMGETKCSFTYKYAEKYELNWEKPLETPAE